MYNTNLVIDSRMAARTLYCKDCHMNFKTPEQLDKHKQRFCIGSTSDPDDLQLRRGFRSTSPRKIISPDDRLIPTTRSAKSPPFLIAEVPEPGDIPVPVQPNSSYYPNPKMLKGGPLLDIQGDGAMSPGSVELPGTANLNVVEDKPFSDSALLLNKKLYQLHKLKEQRTRSRDLHDFEERMLLDQLKDNEARASPVKDRSKMPLSKHQEIQDLQLEYEKLCDNENSVTRHIQGVATSRAGRLTPYSRNSNSSMSIHLDDEYRRNPNQDLQLRNLAQNHGKYMEHLNLRNRDLENQREDIRKQLENLGRKTVAPPQDNTADLLRELREQEMRNQRSLDDLKRQLQDLHGSQRTNVIEIERPVYQQPPAPAPPPPPQPEPPHRPFVFPIYYGKSLVAELSAIRQAYVNNDGNDPEVLAQMAQMMAEAQAIEDEMNKKPEHKSPREKPKDTDNTYRLLTFENDRLNQELRLIQEQNNLAQNRRKSDKEGNQVHLHFTLPKYAFTEKRLKNRKVVRKDSFQASGTNDGLVGLFQPAQSFSYIQQQPLTFYNFPQDQPSVPSYRLQVQQPENSYFQQTQNQYLQQQTEGLYSTTKQQPLKSCYNVPKREHDARSYHSEPRRKSRSGQKVIKFTASHQLDGTVRISRSNSFGYIGRRPRIPPLDLRGLTSPTGNKSGKENTNEKMDDKSVKQGSKIAGGKELRPVDTKLSHVSEGVEPGLRPLADAGTTHLPVLPGQEQKSRPGSQAKPLTRSGHDKPPQIYNYDTGSRAVSPEYRPESNQSLISQRSYLYDADSPMRSEGSLVQDEEPNVAWQVKRSSPGQQNPYEVQY